MSTTTKAPALYALIYLGNSGMMVCDDTEDAIESALNERKRLTEEYGHDQARLHARGLSREEMFDALNAFNN